MGTSGVYALAVTDSVGCKANDTIVCNYDLPFRLSPKSGDYSTLSWSTGGITDTISVPSADSIFITVQDTLGCEASDTMVLTVSKLEHRSNF